MQCYTIIIGLGSRLDWSNINMKNILCIYNIKLKLCWNKLTCALHFTSKLVAINNIIFSIKTLIESISHTNRGQQDNTSICNLKLCLK